MENIDTRKAKNREAQKRYRARHLEKLRAKDREKYAARREEMASEKRAHYAANREARIASSRKWQRANPDKVSTAYRRHNLWRWYRMTIEEFDNLFQSQDKKCAICRCSEVPARHHWHVDHDHSTGKVRGILCSACNLMIGHAKDNADTLRFAVTYIELHS